MTAFRKKHPNGTVGTCTANLVNDPDFNSFSAIRFTFYPNDSFGTWSIIALAQETGTGIDHLMTFNIPMEGDVINKTYSLGGSSAGDATAFYVKSVFGTWHNYPAITGSITVTVDQQTEKLSATFNFDGVSGSKTIGVNNGSLDVTGISDEQKPNDTGSVTANVAGALTWAYQSTEVEYVHESGPNFPPSILAWSRHYVDRPTTSTYILSLRIDEKLIPGTYTISANSQQVIAFFYDMNRRFVAFQAVSGTLNLINVPTPGTQVLRASFNFTATTSDGTETITVSNGTLLIQK